jgi:SAM-dependent methyltransferase
LNRASWDQLAKVHGQDAYYDTEALCAGASTLIAEEEAALLSAIGADLRGKRILHLQCHIGFDAITFARRGARVTGVDFSEVALERARALAAHCGVGVDWVCADVLELPQSLRGSFDLVWATIGVLCWIADVQAWMRSAASVLAAGGKLVLIDGIPRPRLVGRTEIPQGCDYATSTRTGPQVQFEHSVHQIVAAAENAGLRVLRLEEHSSISSGLCLGLSCGDDGNYRRADGQPVLFTLVAMNL